MSSCPRRLQSTVPGQALALLNSPVAIEQARAFAERLLRDCGQDRRELLGRAWQLAFARPITPAESEHALSFLRERETALAQNESAGEADHLRTSEALKELCLALFNANEFVYLD
jgi:hypothetical protein